MAHNNVTNITAQTINTLSLLLVAKPAWDYHNPPSFKDKSDVVEYSGKARWRHRLAV